VVTSSEEVCRDDQLPLLRVRRYFPFPVEETDGSPPSPGKPCTLSPPFMLARRGSVSFFLSLEEDVWYSPQNPAPCGLFPPLSPPCLIYQISLFFPENKAYLRPTQNGPSRASPAFLLSFPAQLSLPLTAASFGPLVKRGVSAHRLGPFFPSFLENEVDTFSSFFCHYLFALFSPSPMAHATGVRRVWSPTSSLYIYVPLPVLLCCLV